MTSHIICDVTMPPI